MKNKNTIVAILVIVLVVGGYYFFKSPSQTTDVEKVSDVAPNTLPNNEVATGTPAIAQDKGQTIIGKSVNGRDIIAYHFGTGDTEIMLVGGIHSGYSWNTTLVAYQAMDYLKANPSAIPANVKVTVIPVLNPDGLYKVVGTVERFTSADVSPSQAIQISGRFNTNGVDLNRNFDCDWQANAKWQSTTVSGGGSSFSEPESLAVKNYIETKKPKAAVVWYSAAGGVYASNCGNGILPETSSITNIYADASGYPAFQNFDFYTTTGDMANWLAKKEIPAISVLLTNHTDTEWTKNQKGIDALLQHYAK